MTESNPLSAIEQALATAAKAPNATPESVKEWLNARKQFLDQDAQVRKLDFDLDSQKRRATFWRRALGVAGSLVFILILILIFRPK